MPKFSDIPQFTRDGSYSVDVPLDYVKEAYERYVDRFGLDLDCDFQRAHAWTLAQKTAYIEFLLRGGRGSNDIRFNHPCWMRFGEDDAQMVCVDGKQRLTACLEFVDNKVPIFGGNYFKDYEDAPRFVKSCLKFIVNDLETRQEVLEWYLQINEGGTPHTEEELEKVRNLLKEEING